MENNIVEKIRRFVEEESKKPTAKYGYEPYEFHLIPVRTYAVNLAKRLGADIEIVELTAWLHDIGSIIYGREYHHITGAEIAEKKLKELGYPESKIEKIKQSILSHRGSNDINSKSLEAQIISDADVISNFDNLPGIFKAAFVYEKLTQGEAKESVREKLKRKWNKLYFKEPKELIKLKYEAAMLLLN
ncbi:HD domain-containing protein [Candidatus Pacearchaeota archaeon]|nr:HD domain-containing protein [Candidatus Pacearchaeota archaeon]